MAESMTMLTQTSPRRGAFAENLRSMREDYAKWRLFRRTLAELGDLGDRELSDLGLTRGAVREAARSSVYG